MQERIVMYQCFAFPGMRKGVENGFKTPDVETLGVPSQALCKTFETIFCATFGSVMYQGELLKTLCKMM